MLKTAAMVRLDWRRSIASPHFISCMRSVAGKAAKDVKGKLVSLRLLVVPRIGDYSAGYRMVVDYTTKNGNVRMVIDTVGFAKGRTEMTLSTTMPIASVPTLFPNEAVLAGLMAGRARA